MDPRRDRVQDASAEVKLERSYTDEQSAFMDSALFDGVVIASPPKYHVSQCVTALEKNMPVLLEKPVSPTLSDALVLQDALKGKEHRLILGYSYRWWPPLQEFFRRLQQAKAGKIHHAQFVMSAHLADWHPWERYQDFFMASKDLGGGALLDESHFLDLMVWFFGMPERIFAKVEKLSSLEIETDDNVDMLALYANGLRVSMHLDLYGRPHEKYIVVEGDKGTLRWSFEPNRIQFGGDMEQKWQHSDFQYERNDMFLNTAKEFLTVLDGHNGISCSLQDGINILKIVEACRQSSRSERTVNLKDLQGD
jgi:predicted dehydrogenase